LRLREITAEDGLDFRPDSCGLRVQIGWKNARRIRVIDWWASCLPGLRRSSPLSRHGVADCCGQRRANHRHCRQRTSPDATRPKLQDRGLPEELAPRRRHRLTPSMKIRAATVGASPVRFLDCHQKPSGRRTYEPIVASRPEEWHDRDQPSNSVIHALKRVKQRAEPELDGSGANGRIWPAMMSIRWADQRRLRP
jgi:hypothetical protein